MKENGTPPIPRESDAPEVTLKYLQYADKMPRWEVQDLEGLFRSLPYLIWMHSNRLVELRDKLDTLKQEEKELRADLKLRSIELKNRKELSSESDRTAWVDSRPEMKEKQRSILMATRDVSMQQNLVERLDHTFTAARKAATLIGYSDQQLSYGQQKVEA